LSEYRAGTGWDVHRLVPGRPLILGGVTVPFELGLEGHSDADVLAHAVTDAILAQRRWATSASIFLRAFAEGAGS
jgi:2-C-methyl-D-erythritol 2,4-cyclodiphosphate synthase